MKVAQTELRRGRLCRGPFRRMAQEFLADDEKFVMGKAIDALKKSANSSSIKGNSVHLSQVTNMLTHCRNLEAIDTTGFFPQLP